MTGRDDRLNRPPPASDGTDARLLAAASPARRDRLRRIVSQVRTSLASRIAPGDVESAPSADSRDLLAVFDDTEELVKRYYPDAEPSADGPAMLGDLIRTRVAYVQKREQLDLWNRRVDIVMKLVGGLGLVTAAALLAKMAGVV